MRYFPRFYKGRRDTITILNRNPLNLYRGPTLLSQHKTIEGAVRAAYRNARQYGNGTYRVRVDGGNYVRFSITLPDPGAIQASTQVGLDVALVLGAPWQPPVVSSTPTPSFTEGTPSTYEFEANITRTGLPVGFDYPIVYSLNGTVDPSLSLAAATGVLTYDGSAGTTYSLTLTVTDSQGADTSDAFDATMVAIDVAPTVSTPSFSQFIQGNADTRDLSAYVTDDGYSPVVYSINGPLPGGVTLAASTGILSYNGIATPDTRAVTFTATDDVGSDTSGSFDVVVAGFSLNTIPTINLAVDGTHDMSQYINNPESLDITTNVTGLNPSYATYSDTTKLLTGVAEGSITGARLVVNSESLRAFPGAEGWGTHTTHGRGGRVIEVTTLADTGAGSLREALTATGPRIIVFTVAGTIELSSQITMRENESDFALFGQTSPGGIQIKNSADASSFVFGKYSAPTQAGHDVVVQHIRFRHGCSNLANGRFSDNVDINGPSYNIVFDHCEFLWAGDESISQWSDAGHDITFSNSIIGEGTAFQEDFFSGTDGWQNTGMLFSGGGSAQGQYKISVHNNLFVHSMYRNPRINKGTNEAAGYEVMNNVHYNASYQHFLFSQKSYTGPSPIKCDIVGEYFKDGPDTRSDNPKDYVGYPIYLNKEGGTYANASFHVSGCTERDINGDPTLINDEVDNTNMVLLGGGAQVDWRGSRFATQPENPVTEKTYLEAYQKVTVTGDVGATKPYTDAVTSRLHAAPEAGTQWSSTNIPTPRGSASYPTLTQVGYYGNDPAKPVGDTSGNGLPDYYQVNVLGKAIGDTYNPAATYTLGRGYSDIEEWVHSL